MGEDDQWVQVWARASSLVQPRHEDFPPRSLMVPEGTSEDARPYITLVVPE